jgi:glycosyltransferase involved in cell wall biosynthesis
MKVSVVITAHNYGKYLSRALESALGQQFVEPFEVVVVDDGSTDYTDKVLAKYAGHPRMRFHRLEGVGLAAACNHGIRNSSGEYVIRLDADDYFDESILLVESNYLDRNPDVGMVFPDYYQVDACGNIMEHVRFPKVACEVKLLDRSPLAAGALYRRECYDALGGYDENLRYQEDYDFWIRFTERFNVRNVNLPLMYYRRHGKSMSCNLAPRMETRRYVKQKYVSGRSLSAEVLAVILARSHDWEGRDLALEDLAGQAVLAYSAEAALRAGAVSRVVVSSDSQAVAEAAAGFGVEAPFVRPGHLSLPSASQEDVLRHTLEHLAETEGYAPGYVVALQINSPLRTARHVQEAINTALIFDTDSVLSVSRDNAFHWKPGMGGLEPIYHAKRFLRKDKETIYRENGAVYLYRAENLRNGKGLGRTVGHIEMFPEESVRLLTPFDFWIARRLLEDRPAVARAGLREEDADSLRAACYVPNELCHRIREEVPPCPKD